uniref:TraB domain-containing protein-like n=1 Tax=Nelumbo nucifera TaxID=4432 RepID=A0A822XNS7_NELNU|nr:TPA_asm: hypothetical protein HUJ06_024727 [Nelumbo nucifera]
MVRTTRLLSSSELSRIIFTYHYRSRSPRYFAGTSQFLSNHTRTRHNQDSTCPNQQLKSLGFATGHREILRFKRTMETRATPLPEFAASVPKDSVHVQNPNLPEIPVDQSGQNSSADIFENPKSSSQTVAMVDAIGLGNASAVTESECSEVLVTETERRKALPEEFSKDVVYLQCESSAEGGSCDVYLVGTAHVSMESCKQVQAVISYLKPQVVFLELCSNRVSVLTRTPQNVKVPTMKEMVDMLKKKKMNSFGILYGWFLAKVANKLEVFPGAEFRVAFEEARKYGGKVILGDRPVNITLRRTWEKMTLWHKVKFLCCAFFQTIFLPSSEDLNKKLKEMDDVDMLTLMVQEMSKAFPTLMETLLYERDLYMSSTLLRVASKHTSVVAVVGKGHLQGIKKHWKQPVKIKDLLEIPEQKPAVSAVKILTSLGTAVTGVAIIYGVYIAGKRSFCTRERCVIWC